MKTYVEARPTTIMKKSWLCRTSYDENNWEIEPFDWDSGSSDDDDDPVMIQLWWWSSNDDLMMIQLWWWSRLDPVTKTCANVLCQENTFLVKRECWCICNIGMYSLVYLILYPDVRIEIIICISLYPDVAIERIINIIKSCKVIEFNPPFYVGKIVPTVEGY